MSRVRDFDQDCLDLRQVETRGHPVIEQAGIKQGAFFVVAIFFVESPSDSLSDAALRLPFGVTRMNRPSDILGYSASQDLNFGCIGIHFDIDAYCRKGIADLAGCVQRAQANDRAAGAGELVGYCL